MSVAREVSISNNGRDEAVTVYDCVSVGRAPHLRDEMLNRTFHLFKREGANFVVEKPFLYTDFNRGQVFLVMPRNRRHQHATASSWLMEHAMSSAKRLKSRKPINYRVVFGLGELREKILAFEHGYQDDMLELVKAFIIHEHPFLVQKPRLRLALDEINHDSLKWIATYDHESSRHEVSVARSEVDGFVADRSTATAWLDSSMPGDRHLLTEGDGSWVNLSSLSPSVQAQESLEYYADRASRGQAIDALEARFTNMIKFLPRGNSLSAEAKEGLDALFKWALAKRDGVTQDALFGIRFATDLEDEWHLNQRQDDISTLWKVLRNVPAAHIGQNSHLRGFQISSAVNAKGWYHPGMDYAYIHTDVVSSSRNLAKTMGPVLLHEVGHAVHEKYKAKVNLWLQQKLGWQEYSNSNEDIDRWILELGGYGGANEVERAQIVGYVRQWMGSGGSWNPPASLPKAPRGHPFVSKKNPVLKACRGSKSSWYQFNSSWHKHNGKRFFINYWYPKLMVVSDDTRQMVNSKMPSRYALMSQLEFFAESYYVLHADSDKVRKKLRRSTLGKTLLDWMTANFQ